MQGSERRHSRNGKMWVCRSQNKKKRNMNQYRVQEIEQYLQSLVRGGREPQRDRLNGNGQEWIGDTDTAHPDNTN